MKVSAGERAENNSDAGSPPSTVFLQRGQSPPTTLSAHDQPLPRLAGCLLSYSFPYTQCCPWGLAMCAPLQPHQSCCANC